MDKRELAQKLKELVYSTPPCQDCIGYGQCTFMSAVLAALDLHNPRRLIALGWQSKFSDVCPSTPEVRRLLTAYLQSQNH
ncbi:MAG: hypothetical protein UX92_C0010G0016 [Candidatus Amesbacteria bacterium GW2011_GWA1_47_20]|uniref:Uncharacterized protein n=1 Tax=Candidatus Amesbacteria bacterium GW2011_GWA1_47_20 TaxID=1618354 RepID=A0A0G1VI95_9BACT|nr:MAG: hypothetical protein UX42_C0021G0016 [Microgenomates group bacterium GW2011_GWC1_46_20]KKU69775.1 MAG: hypothetical protein UX92_C0010G0016 [Candidatus Amesbacteria bacterium GW2011_GWA1_47_20]